MNTRYYTVNHLLEVEGHKLNIGWVKVDPADGLWYKLDRLAVWLELEKAVHGILSFFIYLPIKPYKKKEFLSLVEIEIKEAFGKFAKLAAKEEAVKEQEKQTENLLNAYAKEIQSMLISDIE